MSEPLQDLCRLAEAGEMVAALRYRANMARSGLYCYAGPGKVWPGDVPVDPEQYRLDGIRLADELDAAALRLEAMMTSGGNDARARDR